MWVEDEKIMKNKLILYVVVLLILNGCGIDTNPKKNETIKPIEIVNKVDEQSDSKTDNVEINTVEVTEKDASKSDEVGNKTDDSKKEEKKDSESNQTETTKPVEKPKPKEDYPGYRLISVSGGDTNGKRQANVRVDVGFGDREYWAFTNSYGQLIKIIADKIIVQDDSVEPVNSDGRYYDEEAFVSGVEADDLDQGHVIADSLGGVANAYNITPQNSTLNRHGDQAYMEKVMRQAGGSTNFEATIIYPNTKTQIPSHYKFRYYLNGSLVEHSFANEDPEGPKKTETKPVAVKPAETKPVESKPVETKPVVVKPVETKPSTSNQANSTPSGDSEAEKIKQIDSNGNNKITIKEAKAAGFKMPISSEHWLYKYMHDADGDGLVGE